MFFYVDLLGVFFFSSRRRHTRSKRDWSSDVCSSDLETGGGMHHILGLLNALNREEFVLGVLEKGELYKRATSTGIRTVHFSSNTRMSIPLLHKMIRYIKREKISV